MKDQKQLLIFQRRESLKSFSPQKNHIFEYKISLLLSSFFLVYNYTSGRNYEFKKKVSTTENILLIVFFCRRLFDFRLTGLGFVEDQFGKILSKVESGQLLDEALQMLSLILKR